MVARHDTLERQESFRNPVLGSLVFHAGFVGICVLFGMLPSYSPVKWGDPNSLGSGSVAVTAVGRIPMPARTGRVNPLADDTPSQVPAPPVKTKPQPKRTAKDDADAIPIKGRKAVTSRQPQRAASSRKEPDPENQLYSSSGAAAVSPMFGGETGGSGVGIGQGNPFGDRFGAYVAILRQMVSAKWNTTQVDARLQTAPPVIVNFDIQRDGSVRNLRILQRSGNSTLDFSTQRAIMEASPFPPLPRGFERNSATVEFWFQLKR